MVATPIGNLADISLRALYMLQFADILACEDTRHTQALLHAYGIDRSHTPMLAVHQHNEVECAQQVQELLGLGLRVAYVSDAGTPAISDPGARLVATLRAAHFPVVPLPGACSVTAALSVAGIAPGTTQQGAFVFAGFLPQKTSERTAAIEALVSEVRTVVLLEAPHRIESLATALALLNDRLITVGRELTKQFEEIATLQAKDFASWLEQDGHRLLGEFTLVLHPTSAPDTPPNLRVLKLLLDQLPLKTAVKLAAQLTGEPRNSLYALALSLKAGAGSKDLISG
jgi:16S rRNA (cytidine1402-2'-O)-methyltransferase